MSIKYVQPNDNCKICGKVALVRKYMLCRSHYLQYLRKNELTKPRWVKDETKSFGYLYPHLAKDWAQDRNGDITPITVYPNTDRLFWWICPDRKHLFDMTIYNRIAGQGCPYCKGVRLVYENSLAYRYPEIAAEWDYQKNADLNPEQVHSIKKLKVAWICPKYHSYLASIDNRTNRGSGCPYCCGRLVCMDNCLATIRPDLAWEWHPTKNGDLTPFDITPGRGTRIWWLCKTTRVHEWQATANNRSTKNSSCPYCNGRKIWKESMTIDTDWKLHYKSWYLAMEDRKRKTIVR